jgi:hypothetical protein
METWNRHQVSRNRTRLRFPDHEQVGSAASASSPDDWHLLHPTAYATNTRVRRTDLRLPTSRSGVHAAPLRNGREDIPILVEHVLE